MLSLSRNSKRNIVTSTARIMLPDDSNPNGNVHGGVLLKMLEECGLITASRHLVSKKPTQMDISNQAFALARADRVDFENPMHIGSLAQLQSRVTFAGKKSLEVQVNVFSENLKTGEKKQTNKASLWYVLVEDFCKPSSWVNTTANTYPPKLIVSKLEVPPIEFNSKKEEEEAYARYELQKKARLPSGDRLEALLSMRHPNSLPILSHVAHPNECFNNGSIYGGVVMKLMDSAAGTVAVQYCRTNCVTASVESLNMVAPIFNGNLIKVYAHPTFTSARTLEVAVHVEAEDIVSGNSWHAVSAHLTFVSLDSNGKVMPVPPLKPLSHEARVDFHSGEERYRLRKKQRANKV